MSKLFRELQRLYFPGTPLSLAGRAARAAGTPGAAGERVASLDLAGASGLTRAMLVRLRQSADWESLARLYEAVQQDLGFPAPAVSVAGSDGFSLWFSLAEPVALAQADDFLAALCERYLGALGAASVILCPTAERSVELPPAWCASSERWSAFIDPSMGGMFIEQAGLDMTPSRDRQADILAALTSVKADDFARALAILGQGVAAKSAAAEPANGKGDESRPFSSGDAASGPGGPGRFDDPRSFLLAVMNDASSPAPLRVEAAKALLPYFEKIR